MKDRRLIILLIVSIIAIGTIFFLPPIPQDICYHDFSDNRMFWGIANFWNVISNVPFFIAGLMGLFFSLKYNLSLAHILFYTGIFCVGLGSAYYHISPSNSTLLWDRLPMTVAFMSFFSIVVSAFINDRVGKKLLMPFIFAGVFSILYWHYSELYGKGDLRFYALVQFLPMLLIPIILILYKGANKRTYFLVLLLYAIAKIFEASDNFIFNLSACISGHTIKHLIASMAPIVLLHCKSVKTVLISNDKV